MSCLINRIVISFFLVVLPIISTATTLRVDVRTPEGVRAGAGVEITVTESGVLADSPNKATTDHKSRVVFSNVREGAATVSATRDDARGEWRGEIGGKNQNIKITLQPGVVGEPAIAPAQAEAGEQLSSAPLEEEMGVGMPGVAESIPPQAALQINQDAECTALEQVYLTTTVSGPLPSQYRASEDSSLADATWTDYEANPAFKLSAGGGFKRVYYQVRSLVDGAYLLSNIASDSIERVVSNAHATLSINGGADTTFSRTVTLNNVATFDGGGTNPRYLASESDEFVDAQWQSYSTSPTFTLSEGAGAKTVYFLATREVCGAVVGTNKAVDTINLGEVVVSEVAVGTAPAPVDAAPAPAPTKAFYFEWAGVPRSNWRQETVATVGDLARTAQQYGFVHTAQKIAGEGTCNLVFSDIDMNEKPALFLVATPVVENTTNILVKSLICEFTLFAGRKLNSGWAVKRFGVPDNNNLIHPMGIPGKWVGTAGLVDDDHLLNHVVRITVPAYQCGLGTLEFCPNCTSFKPSGFSCWSLGTYYPNFDIVGPESATDWHDAVKQ